MILMVVIRARGIDPGQQHSARVNAFPCRRAWRCAVSVLGNDFRAREDVTCCPRASAIAFISSAEEVRLQTRLGSTRNLIPTSLSKLYEKVRTNQDWVA